MLPLSRILCFTGLFGLAQAATAAEDPKPAAPVAARQHCGCLVNSIMGFTWDSDGDDDDRRGHHSLPEEHSHSIAEGFSRGTLRPFIELTGKESNPGDETLHMQGLRLGLVEHGERELALAYYRTANDTRLNSGTRYRLDYGGFVFGGIPDVRSITEAYFTLLLGTGQARITSAETTRSSRLLFVIEPELGLGLNLSSWLQIAAGVSYRYLNGLQVLGVRSEDLRGWTANAHLRLHF